MRFWTRAASTPARGRSASAAGRGQDLDGLTLALRVARGQAPLGPGWARVAACFATALSAALSLPPTPPGEAPPGDTLALLVEVLLTSP
ncbi:MAG: hypothetical protein KA712_03055 [Myxococcales bacterium]|nr:hypothetical protein [Myxococcales bacterium]